MTDEQKTDERATGEPQRDMEETGAAQDTDPQAQTGGADTPEVKAEQSGEGDGGETKISQDDDEATKARKAEERRKEAQEELKEWEQKEADELPTDLSEWPSGAAKYETFGGPEGEEGYEESVTAKLGPSSLRHREDGTVEIAGEEVEDSSQYKAEPLPGGPTDPGTPLNPRERAAQRIEQKEEAGEDSPRGGREGQPQAEGGEGGGGEEQGEKQEQEEES